MAQQRIDVEAFSGAPPGAVWTLLEDVTTWTRWAGFDEAAYEHEGRPAPHGLGAVRRMRAGRLRSRETVLAFDRPRHFAYDYAGSVPVKDYRADVELTPHDGGTRISWGSAFLPRVPLTGPLLRMGLTRVLRDISQRLARAAEAEQRSDSRSGG